MRYNDGKTTVRRRRRYAPRKKKSPLSSAQKREVSSIAKKVSLKTPERKHIDTYDDNYQCIPYSGAPTPIPLSPLSQDVGQSDRIGNSVKPVYVGLRYYINAIDGAAQQQSLVRVVLAQFRPNTADTGTPAFTDLFIGPAYPMDYYNYNHISEFKILYDAKHVLVSDVGNEAYSVYQDINIPMSSLSDIHYNGTATTGDNLLYLFVLSDYNNADTKNPVMNYFARLTYLDA